MEIGGVEMAYFWFGDSARSEGGYCVRTKRCCWFFVTVTMSVFVWRTSSNWVAMDRLFVSLGVRQGLDDASLDTQTVVLASIPTYILSRFSSPSPSYSNPHFQSPSSDQSFLTTCLKHSSTIFSAQLRTACKETAWSA